MRLSNKSRKFAQCISLAALMKLEAMMLYTSYFLPSIGYGLGVGILTLLQAAQIQSNPVQILLPKMGFNQKTTREVVFGPRAMGRLGLRHLFAEQGTQKVQMIIQQLRIQRPLGKLLTIQLRWAQRRAGTAKTILTGQHRESQCSMCKSYDCNHSAQMEYTIMQRSSCDCLSIPLLLGDRLVLPSCQTSLGIRHHTLADQHWRLVCQFWHNENAPCFLW
jgi:hypothetical protein